MGTNRQLSANSCAILQMIAAGRSYEQILKHCSELTYKDIFAAAQEALDLVEAASVLTGAQKKDTPMLSDN